MSPSPIISSKPSTRFGFTLIELLVVLTLMGLISSIVGPLVIGSIEKNEAKSELLELKNWLNKSSSLSFSTRTTTTLLFDSNSLTYKGDSAIKELNGKIHFRFLKFPLQEVIISNSGFFDVKTINLIARGRRAVIDLDLIGDLSTSDKSAIRFVSQNAL